MNIIKDKVGAMGETPEIAIYLLRRMNGQPANSVQIQCKCQKSLEVIHDKLFKVVKGRYEANDTGALYGAFITASSFTIGLNTTNIKKVATTLGIDTVRIIRYTTL